MEYTTTTREDYREYKSNSTICAACPCLYKCTLSKNQTKVVTCHVWTKYVEEAEHLRHCQKIREEIPFSFREIFTRPENKAPLKLS